VVHRTVVVVIWYAVKKIEGRCVQRPGSSTVLWRRPDTVIPSYQRIIHVYTLLYYSGRHLNTGKSVMKRGKFCSILLSFST
jgi:hypothetical protein